LLRVGAALAWLWLRLKQPNPWLLGPLLVSAVVCVVWDLKIGLPNGASQLGELLIGSGLGGDLIREFFRRARAFMARTL
ncbi:AbrB family transcriptional regulator, partial [Pseudomonas syringae group genomosp. 7]|uniref:AbrB family transcriptional regulator n=1 Tax=Pseudomonas syringae group genomosp. 7 TaxID=251699 RepID=UPI00377035B2